MQQITGTQFWKPLIQIFILEREKNMMGKQKQKHAIYMFANKGK